MHTHLLKVHSRKMAETTRPITALFPKALPSPQATMTKDRSDAITRAITNYIVLDMRPFSTVERQGFKELISVLEPNYKIISKTHLSQTIIPTMYIRAAECLKGQLAKLDCIAASHDSWTSCNTESFGTITIHFINDMWELKSFVLQTKKVTGHTGEVIAAELNEAIENWGIETSVVIVTYNASNELKAVRILDRAHISCHGHNINLAVRDALNIRQISNILAK